MTAGRREAARIYGAEPKERWVEWCPGPSATARCRRRVAGRERRRVAKKQESVSVSESECRGDEGGQGFVLMSDKRPTILISGQTRRCKSRRGRSMLCKGRAGQGRAGQGSRPCLSGRSASAGTQG